MISNRVANSAAFLQMPADAQLLFFHMILRADDDGVVELYPLLKLVNVAPDSVKVLFLRGFVKELNDDQVVIISEWNEHNKIRSDRKVDSLYRPVIERRYPEIDLISPKPRTDVKDNSKRVDGPRTAEVKLSKDNKDANASFDSSKIKEVKIDSQGEEKVAKETKKRDLTAWALTQKLYGMLAKETGVQPTQTTADYIRIMAARKYLKDKEVVEMFESALANKQIRTVREVFTDRQIDTYRQENV